MTEHYDLGERKCIIHRVTCEQKEEATNAGTTRRNYHMERGSTKHYVVPNEGEYDAEVYGCLGEIAFRDIVKKVGLESVSKFHPLYSITKEDWDNKAECDAEIYAKTIEVKTVMPPSGHKTRILVKKSEYKEGIDFYVAIKFIDEERYILAGFCTDEELKRKKPMTVGQGGPCYWMFLEDLHHMIPEWWKFDG